MPVQFVGDQAEAVAFDRLRHNGLRPPFHGLGPIQRGEHRGHVMSVDHLRIEAFRLEFQPVTFHVVLIHRRLALAEPVDVGDHGQIIEVVMGSECGRFPDLPFRQFTVAGKHVDLRQALIHPRADCEAEPTESPWPNDPVAASTPWIRGVGCPSSSLVNCLSVMSRETGNTPASASAA